MSEEVKQSEIKERFVEIKDEFILIKATPIDKMPLAKKIIQEKANQIEARERFQQNAPKFKTEADYRSTQARSKLDDGTVVMGSFTESEKRALRTNNDALIRKCVMLREKTRQKAHARMLEGKTQRDYFSR